MVVEFFVPGHPVPKQSFRALKRGGGYIDAGVRAWQDQVRELARRAMAGMPPSRSWMEVELDFVLGHNRRVDLDNLSKGVLDALKAVVYQDDTQIVDLLLHKRGGQPAGVYVLVTEVSDDPEERA
jgi:Holliday junction resolvase RusA-like endonuclease